MERHAAIPDLYNVEGMGEIVAGIVEQYVAQPPADDHAERGVDNEVVDRLRRGPRRAAPVAIIGDNAADEQPADDAARL